MKVKITSLDHFGRGITRDLNKITFVKNALVDEIVDIKITKECKKYNEAIINSIIKPSDKRRNAMCKYYDVCEGCNIMHLEYSEQLKFKKEKVENILKKYANLDVNVTIEPSNEFNYRNKITLHNKNGKLGYINNDDIIEIDDCLIAKESINKYLKQVNNFNDKELVIRCNEKEEVISNVNNGYIIENINEYKFRIDINSFFQVNNYICSKVFDYIKENIDNVNVALDLYSGVSTLGILISSKSNKVYSIEENKYSHLNAIENLKLNNIKNIILLNGKVEDEISKIKEKVDLIITDPPRSGMDKFTIDTILNMKPNKIVYMSCDPMSLARDLKLLNDDYNLEKMKLFDMFANTYHIETVMILEKKDD